MDITRRAWSIGFLSIGAASVAVLSSCAGQDGRTPSGSGSGADHGSDEGPAPDTVVFSLEAGAYPDDPLELVLENPSGHGVAYTTDGSIPTAESPLADGPILLDSSDTNAALIPLLDAEQYDQSKSVVVDPTLPTATLIRASAVLPDGSMGPVNTSIFFVGEDLPALFGDAMVVSLAIDPESLFDYETGIMALGAIYDEHLEENKRVMEEGHSWDTQANCTQKGRDWEREAHVEVFDCSNSVSAEGPCGLRLRGSFSRIFAQKGFNVYFRKSYGMESLEYPLFGDAAVSAEGEPIEYFESFCLRPGGNGTESLPFRDSLLQELLSDGAALTQISRPAIVFLNGEFYGVVCLNEKYSDAYFESHFGVDADNVVLIKDGEVDEGEDEDIELYDALQAYAERDLSDEAAWNEFSEVADTRSLADYFAAQICICNTDLQNERNILLWRSREVEDGNPYGDTRWRWILYDLDYTCGMYDQGSTPREHDIVGQYLDTIPLFAQAMRNADFRDMVRERLVELVEGPLGNTRAVEAFRTRWDAWKPWMEMGAKRFALDARMAEYDFAGIKVFFTGHAESILRIFDEHAAEL